MIRRRGQQEEEESSSDEEDAFSALGSKSKKPRLNAKPSLPPKAQQEETAETSKNAQQIALPKSITSSMKRHHYSNENRKAKMDALLQELEAEKSNHRRQQERQRFVPDKKGSFVDPSEEKSTSNIFVGNLCPSITE